ncbi:hypothetical protein OPQ81_001102 [Rhizoctonia solani]|nr:hypothetical protein OPQ81_001102 [Rhizoctonia solani]
MVIVPIHGSDCATKLLHTPDALKGHWHDITLCYQRGNIHNYQLTPPDLFSNPGFDQWGHHMMSNTTQFQIPGLEKSWKQKNKLLQPLPPVQQLSPTKDKFFMLEPVPFDEQMYGCNYEITKELPHQMKVDMDEKLVNWASIQMRPWVGDLLTIQCL